MTQCNTKTRVDFHPQSPIDIEFSADDISSDGGAVLLRQVEDDIGICEMIAGLIPDARDPDKIVHSRREQIFQRVFQIALGYEDQNDANWLRDDPVLKAVCDVDVDDGQLSSQPTLSRLENTVDDKPLARMQMMLVLSWIRSLDEDRRQITIDIDSSGFEGHGDQEQLAFCGFFGGHKLHPLLMFDGETGQLITVIARGGSAGDAAEITDWIGPLITALNIHHRRDCSVVVRADSGFATPRLYQLLDELDEVWGQVGYLIGFKQNSVVNSRLESSMNVARQKSARSGDKARVFTDFEYAAGSWERSRTIIGKAEVTTQGDNPRFVVTNFDDICPRLAYEVGYCGRGRCEQWIGEYKGGLCGDRISCTGFEANGFRMILHAVAYRLMFALRAHLAEQARRLEQTCSTDRGQSLTDKCRRLARVTFTTLRLRLLKVAFVVRRSVRRIFLQGARSFPMADVFHHVARAMN